MTRRVIAEIYASQLVNGDKSDVFSNTEIINELAKQFITWDDLDYRVSVGIFMVRVIPFYNELPNFQDVNCFAISARSYLEAVRKCCKFLSLDLEIVPGNNTFYGDGYMLKVQKWTSCHYHTNFQIL